MTETTIERGAAGAAIRGAKLRHVIPSKLRLTTRNVRADADLGDIDALAGDIRENGVKSPLLCLEWEDGSLETVRGFRRAMACHKLGADAPKTVPVLVLPKDTPEAVVLALFVDTDNAVVPTSLESEVRIVERLALLDTTEEAIAKAMGFGSRTRVQMLKVLGMVPAEVRSAVYAYDRAKRGGKESLERHLANGGAIFTTPELNLMAKSYRKYLGIGQGTTKLDPKDEWENLWPELAANRRQTQKAHADSTYMIEKDVIELRGRILGNAKEDVRDALVALCDVVLGKPGARLSFKDKYGA